MVGLTGWRKEAGLTIMSLAQLSGAMAFGLVVGFIFIFCIPVFFFLGAAEAVSRRQAKRNERRIRV